MNRFVFVLLCACALVGTAPALVTGWDDWKTATTNATSGGYKNDATLGTQFAITMTVTFNSAPNVDVNTCPSLISFGVSGGNFFSVAFNGWQHSGNESPLVLTGAPVRPDGEDATTVGVPNAATVNDDVSSAASVSLEQGKEYTLSVVRDGNLISVYWGNELVIQTERLLEGDTQSINYIEWGQTAGGGAALSTVAGYTIGSVQYSTTKAIPEPTALALLALGVAGVALRRRAA